MAAVEGGCCRQVAVIDEWLLCSLVVYYNSEGVVAVDRLLPYLETTVGSTSHSNVLPTVCPLGSCLVLYCCHFSCM